MSLQVWLPMTKDLRQQGLSDVEVTNNGATFQSTEGKLGGCYSFDGIDDNFSYIPNVDELEAFSVAIWVCPDAAAPKGVIFGLERGTYWQFELYRNTVGIRDNSIGWNGTRKNFSTGTYIANVWTHLVVTYNNGELKVYRDGALNNTYTVGGSKLNTGIDGARIGSAVQAGYYHAGKINDFRFYDHCLSPMEVKQISQGLVLHYPLNREGWGQENLLLNSNDLTLWPIESSGKIELQEDGYFKVSSKASNTTRYGIYYDFTFPEPDTYTFSVDVRDDWLIGVAPASTFTWTTANLSGTQGKKRISYTCTSTEEKNKCRIYIAGTGTGGRVTYLKQPKLEKGSIATPWCPNSSDALATTMGLNSTTEYDCSGFCNNGTRTGTFTWFSDTPKYNVSQYFNGSSYILTDSGTFSWFDFNQLTLAGWMKPTNSPSSYSGSFGIAHDSIDGYYSKCFSISNSKSKFTINAAKGSTWVWITTPYTIPTNEWHHYVVTLNETEVKMYVDGELVHSTTIDWGTGTIASDTRFQVGVDLPGSDETYQGYYSNICAYATALSASDVKALYNANKL